MKQYYDDQSAVIARTSREASVAEERLAFRRIEETGALQRSLQYELGGTRNPHADIQHALAVARAARATVLAEKDLAAHHVQEAQLFLQTSHDAEEAVNAKLQLADKQLADVLQIALPFSTRLLPPTIAPDQPDLQHHHLNPQTNSHLSVILDAPLFNPPLPDAEAPFPNTSLFGLPSGTDAKASHPAVILDAPIFNPDAGTPFPNTSLLDLPLGTDAEPLLPRSPHSTSPTHPHPASLLLSTPSPSTAPPIPSPHLGSPNLALPLNSPLFYTPRSHTCTPFDSPRAGLAVPQPHWSEAGSNVESVAKTSASAEADGLG
jgi:hypothetical protein